MITREDLQACHEVLAEIDSPGLRKVCCVCQCELPGSDQLGKRISHGLCVEDFNKQMAQIRKEAA